MLDRFLRGMFFLSLLFLAFMLGIVASIHQTIFYTKTKEIYEYVDALKQKYDSGKTPFDNFHWTKQSKYKVGVTVSNSKTYSDGLTFIATNNAQAYLVDMQGQIVHSWHHPYSTNNTSEDDDTFLGGAWLFPNGDLLVIYEGLGDISGRVLIKMDKDSNVLWKYEDTVNHMLNVDTEGHIYVPVNSIAKKNTYGLPNLQPPFVDDAIAILDANGKLIKKISLIGAFAHSPFANMLDNPTDQQPLHTNQVAYIGDIADKFPFTKKGDILLSLRNINAIAILDPKKEVITWAKTGFWYRQHDPILLENGHILIFNNLYHAKATPGKTIETSYNRSEVAEFDPITLKKYWTYTGNKESFYSAIRGMVQRLPNGNTMIVESGRGRILEITPSGNKAWEYYNPLHAGPQKQYIAHINFAQRFPRSALTFLSDTGSKIQTNQ